MAILSLRVLGQDILIPDTIHLLPTVQINAKQNLEYAGTLTSVVDSLIVAQKRTSSLSELLSENTSVFIKTYGRGALATASFRGTGSSHTQISWNGVPIVNPMLGMADFSLIPAYVSDMVQLEHGLSAVWMGSGALGGRILLKTMPDFNPGFSVDLQTSIASFHSFDEYAVISASTQKFQSKTAVYYRASQNDFSFENTDILNGGVQTRENADYQNYGVVQQCFFRLNNYHLLSAKLWWQASKRSIPMLTTNESGADNSFNRQADNSLRAVINWDYNKNSLHIQSDAAISNQITNYTLKNYINGFGYLTAIQANGNANSLFSNAQVSWNFSEKFTARAATSLSYHMVNSLESVYRTGYDTSRLESSFSAAIFYDSRSRFRAGVVLKQEVYNNQLSPFIPVLQCDYNVNEVLTLKANIGRNFHTPSLNDLYYQPGGNTALLPEKGYTAEMGVAGSKKTDNFYWNAEITGFFNDIEDWIIWNPTLRGYWTPVNIEKVLAYGIETSIEGNIHINNLQFNVHCNYALTRSVQQSQQVNEMDLSFDRQLPYIPIHSANVFAVISYKKYSLSWQWNYFSERYTTTGNDNSSFAMLYPYIMNDVYCSKDFSISKHLMSIQVGVYNIFNESYHSVLWQPMPGINYRISVRYRLGINSKNSR